MKVIYPGNTRTCARCHSAPSQCPGHGIARQCEANGTDRVPITTHLKQLWNRLDTINSERSRITEQEEGYIGVPVGAGGGDLGSATKKGVRVMKKEIRLALATINWTSLPLIHPHPPKLQ